MLANKYTIGYRKETKGVGPAVWVILRDAKIATMVSKKEFFDERMHHGCFIENLCYETREEMDKEAIALANRFGCRFVTPAEFRKAEKEGESQRISKAFAEAERLIKLS